MGDCIVMDRIRLFDGTTAQIDDFASIGSVISRAGSSAAAEALAEKITPENLAHVEFLHDDLVNGVYNDLASAEGFPEVDGQTVIMSFVQQ